MYNETGDGEPSLYITGGKFTGYIYSNNANPTETWIIKDENTELSLPNITSYAGKLKIKGVTAPDTYTSFSGVKLSIEDSTLGSIDIGNYDNSKSGDETIKNVKCGGIKKDTTGDMLITDSTITGISNNNKGNITIKNTKVNGMVSNTNAGTIDIPCEGETEIRNSYIAVENSGSGTITVGTKGNGVSEEYPRIEGSNTGIYNSNESGKIYIYDGIFVGKTAESVKGIITDTEPGYDICNLKRNGGKRNGKY